MPESSGQPSLAREMAAVAWYILKVLTAISLLTVVYMWLIVSGHPFIAAWHCSP